MRSRIRSGMGVFVGDAWAFVGVSMECLGGSWELTVDSGQFTVGSLF